MSSNWLDSVAADKDLSGEDFRVLLTLLASSEGSRAEISQTEIAQKLGISRSHVSRAIANLCRKGFISKKKVGGRLVGYSFAVTGDKSAEQS